MTVPTETSRTVGLGNGSATVFSFPFQVYDVSEVEVRKIDTNGNHSVPLVPGTGTFNYIVQLTVGPLPSAGTVTYPATGSANVLASGEKILILRKPKFTQETDLENQSGYFPEVQEKQYDELVYQTQWLKENVDRSIQLPFAVAGNISHYLPQPSATKYIGWNDAGTALENKDPPVDGSGDPVDPPDPTPISGILQLDDGSESAPTYSWAHSTNSGWYWDDGTDSARLSIEGQDRIIVNDEQTIDLLTIGVSKFPSVRIVGETGQTKGINLRGDDTEPAIEAADRTGGESSIAIRATSINNHVDFRGRTPFGVQATEHGLNHSPSTNCAPLLELLASQLTTTGGATILFEEGDYYLANDCNISSNIKLLGQGKVRFMLAKGAVLRTAGTYLFDETLNNVRIRSTVASGSLVWPINIGVAGGDISRFAVGTKWRIRGAGGGGIEVRDDQDLTVVSTDGVDDVTMNVGANATYLISWDPNVYPEAAAYVAKYPGETDYTLLAPFVMQVLNANVPKGQQFCRIPTNMASNYVVGEVYLLGDDTVESDIAGDLVNRVNIEYVRIAKKVDEGSNVTKLTFSSPSRRSYTTAKGAALFRINWAENVTFENLEFVKYEAPSASPAARVPAVELRFCKNSYGINLRYNGQAADQAGIRGNQFRLFHAYDSEYINCFGSDPKQSGSGDGYIFSYYYSTGGGFRNCVADGGRHNYISQCGTSYKWLDLTSRNALISDLDSHGVKDVHFEWGNVTIHQSELRSSDANTSVAGCRIGNTSHPAGAEDGSVHDIVIFGSGSTESRAIDLVLPFKNINVDNVTAFNIYDGVYTRSNSLSNTLIGDTAKLSNLNFHNIGRYGLAILGDSDSYVGYQLKNLRFNDIYFDNTTGNTAIRAIQVDGIGIMDVTHMGNGSTAAPSFYFDDVPNLVVDGIVGRNTYTGFSITDCPSALLQGGPIAVDASGSLLIDNGGNTAMDFQVTVRPGNNPIITNAGAGPSSQRAIELPGRQRGKVITAATYTLTTEDLNDTMVMNGSSVNGDTVVTIPLVMRSTETALVGSATQKEIGAVDFVSVGTAGVVFTGGTGVTVVVPDTFITLSAGQMAKLTLVRTGASTANAYISVAAGTSGGGGGDGIAAVVVANSIPTINAATYTVTADDANLSASVDTVTQKANLVRRSASLAGTVVITMPTSSAITPAGSAFMFVQDTDQTGLVTITPASGGTIDGGTGAITMGGPRSVVVIQVVANPGNAPEMVSIGDTRSDGTVHGNKIFSDSVTISNDLVVTDETTLSGPVHITGTGFPITNSLAGVLPGTSGASALTNRDGGSTPVEKIIEGWQFDPAADEMVDFMFVVPSWFPTGKGVNVKFACVTDATTGDVVFQAAFRRLDAAEDVDGTHTYVYQTSGATTVSSPGGVLTYITVPFSSTQLDGFQAGEAVIMRLRRDADNTSGVDSVTGNDVLVIQKTVRVEVA